MKAFLRGLLGFGFLVATTVQADLTLTTTGTVQYTFDTYNGSAAPADWSVTALGGSVVYQGLDRGSGQSQGARAYTNSLPAVNRSFGFLEDATVTNYLATLVITNNTGLTLTDLTLSFDVLQYRMVTNSRLSTVTFTDVSGLGLVGQTFTASNNLATGAQNPPIALGSYSQTLNNLSILNGDTFTFRWTFDRGIAVGGTGAAQGLALDNVSLTVIPELSSMLLVGAGLAGLLAVRRRR
jgi:hypothetical protein